MADNFVDKLHAAISNVLAEHSGALVNKWLLVVESLHDDGRMVSYVASEGVMTWEVIGLAETASHYARTQLVVDYEEIAEEDDESDR